MAVVAGRSNATTGNVVLVANTGATVTLTNGWRYLEQAVIRSLEAPSGREGTVSSILGDYLLLGRGEEEHGGRQRLATLCATFEALIGALYLDQSIEPCRAVLLRLFHTELTVLETAHERKDAKSRLQELAQELLGFTPRYRPLDSTGPDHDKYFVMVVQIQNKAYGIGEGRSKQEASQRAAAMALYYLGDPLRGYAHETTLAQRYDLPLPPPPHS